MILIPPESIITEICAFASILAVLHTLKYGFAGGGGGGGGESMLHCLTPF